jgi:hypothetical protein
MDIFGRIVSKIISEQETIIGPLALEQAKKIDGLKVDWEKHEVAFDGDEKTILDKLVQKYNNLFGLASVEVCKEAVNKIIAVTPKDQVPQILLHQ